MTCGVLIDVFFSRTFFSFANENYSRDVDAFREDVREREKSFSVGWLSVVA